VWRWFLEMHADRGEAGRPLPWATVAAWSAVRGIRLAPLEVDVLRALDAGYLDDCRRREEHERKSR
jgi:hypothetical protein